MSFYSRAQIASCFALGFFSALTLCSATLDIVGWNLESGESDIEFLADVSISVSGVDVWGLSEVQNLDTAESFAEVLSEREGRPFEVVLGTTGGADRLAVLFDSDRFVLADSFELHAVNTTGRVRAPLVVRLEDSETDIEFMLMVNHLYRGRKAERHQQARLLNEWVQNQGVPVIAVGDYNFDWDVSENGSSRDDGFDLMIAGNHWTWVQPDPIVVTHLSSRYDSILDFTFVSQLGSTWEAESRVLQIYGQPDDDDKSDHLPVLASFTVDSDSQPMAGRLVLLDRIERIESQLSELRQIIESMPE